MKEELIRIKTIKQTMLWGEQLMAGTVMTLEKKDAMALIQAGKAEVTTEEEKKAKK